MCARHPLLRQKGSASDVSSLRLLWVVATLKWPNNVPNRRNDRVLFRVVLLHPASCRLCMALRRRCYLFHLLLGTPSWHLATVVLSECCPLRLYGSMQHMFR